MMMRRTILLCMFFAGFWLVLGSSASAQYWKVAGSTSEVWSLTQDALVPVTDSTYVAWLAAGNMTSSIVSTSELYDVISLSYPTHLAASAPNLEANGGLTPEQAFTWRKIHGVNIVYTGTPDLDGLYAVDDQWLGGLMTGALIRCGSTILESCVSALPFGASTYTYLDKTLSPHSMSIVQMRTISLAIEDHFAKLYEQLKVGIDGGTPVWPSLTVTVP